MIPNVLSLRLLIRLMVGLFFLALLGLVNAHSHPQFAIVNFLGTKQGISQGDKPARAEASSSSFIYLPSVFRNYPGPNVFGIQIGDLSNSSGLDRVAQTKTRYIHGPGIHWSTVERGLGMRDWSVLATLEQELLNASSRNLEPVVNVHSTPPWAWTGYGLYCGPIAPGAMSAFGDFMHDLVVRYSVPPFNVKYWEIWNEPDIDPKLVPWDGELGCWGNDSDSNYGGGYYAKMLQAVYPKIKAADPQAQLLIGGLLLDCDPRSVCSIVGHNSRPARFLEGILLGGGAPYFDGVSFHVYDYYQGALGQYGLTGWASAWNTTGPALISKTNFIMDVLSRYGVAGKYLFNTEAGLQCPTACGTDFENTKAFYLVQDYAIAAALGMRGNIWYSLYGENGTGLLDTQGNPLPAYTAFSFASRELAGVGPGRAITEYPGVKGYELNRGDRIIWTLWSGDGSSNPIVPSRGTPLAVWDALGNSMVPTNPVTITIQPLYLEWSP